MVNDSSQGWFPKAVATGAWLMLLGLNLRFPADIHTVGFAACVLLAVALCSAISLLQCDLKWKDVPTRRLWVQYILVAVSLTVPLIWAIQFSFSTPPYTLPMFVMLGIFPPLMVLVQKAPVQSTAGEHPTDFHDEDSSTEDRPEGIRTFLQIVHDDSSDDVEESEDDSTPQENVTQWLQRSITGDNELIEGHVRVDFREGQRDAVVHISFCPPFETMPKVVAEDLGSHDLEIRVAAIFKFGVRLTVRRPPIVGSRNNPTTNSYRIGFAAEAPSSQGAA